MKTAILTLSLVVIAATASAQSVAIPRLESELVIDGRLDELVWQQAARLDGFHQYEPVDGRAAEIQHLDYRVVGDLWLHQ